LWWLGAAVAAAELPLPSYEVALAAEAEAEFWRRFTAGDVEAARAGAHSWRAVVADVPVVAALEGTALRRLGRLVEAEPLLVDATTRAPELASAWVELGEIQLAGGRLAEADASFAEAEARGAAMPHPFVPSLRRAVIAGRNGDADALEDHLRAAVLRGCDLSALPLDAQWVALHGDPELADRIDKIVTVYGDDAARRAFDRAPPTP
jgi:hypothetical protein